MSKHGKARCWLLWLAIPISLATVLVFLVPNIGPAGQYIFVIITYNLVTTFLYTMINIPYGALTSLMTRDQNQRTVINVFRMFMAQVGSLIINAFTLPLINAAGGSSHQKSWIIVSVIYGVIAAALFLACFFKTKERVQISSQQKESIPLGESFRLIMRNNYWLIIVGVWVVTALGMGMGMSVGTYYAKYILGDEKEKTWKRKNAASYSPPALPCCSFSPLRTCRYPWPSRKSPPGQECLRWWARSPLRP